MAVWGLDRDEMVAIADEIGFRPKRSGRHFLYEPDAVGLVISMCDVSDGDHVLEIGPGMGALTVELLGFGAYVAAVEVDPKLARQLPHTVSLHTHSEVQRLSVRHEHVRTLSATDLEDDPSLVLLHVPPDAATGAVLHLLAEFPSVRRVVAIGASLVDRWQPVSRGARGYDVAVAKLRYLAELRVEARLPRRRSGPSQLVISIWCAWTSSTSSTATWPARR